jgi:hypothetical protein
MWNKYILISILGLITISAFGQKPKSGIYIYKVAFVEWKGKSLGQTVIVKIIDDSIYIIHNGGSLSGVKGEIIDQGIIMKHTSTGKWIIGHSTNDKESKEIGGCSEGPRVIDFKRKRFWLC